MTTDHVRTFEGTHMSPAAVPKPYTTSILAADDLPILAAIDHDSQDPWNYKRWEEVLESPWMVGVVARAGGELAGCIVYSVSDKSSKKDRKDGRLTIRVPVIKVVVSASQRRKGVGKFLISQIGRLIQSRFRSKGNRHGRVVLSVMVPERRLDVQLFLKKCDYRVPKEPKVAFHKTPFDYCDDDGYLFRRALPLDVSPKTKIA